MPEFIIFTIGLLIGSLSGITVMCLVQINRMDENRSRNEKEN